MSISSYTPNFGLALIDYNSQNWHDDEHNNWKLVDGIVGAPTVIPFGVAATADGGTNFTTTIAGITSYYDGLRVSIYFNTSLSFTPKLLNINGLGAARMYAPGKSDNLGIQQYTVATFVYTDSSFMLVAPITAFASLFAGNSPNSGIAEANEVVLCSTDNTGISVLANAAGKTAAVYLGRNGGDFYATLGVSTTSKELELAQYAGGGSTTPNNKIAIKADRTLSDKQLGIKDSSAGSDFMMVNSAANQVTLGFLGGSANGFKFNRTGPQEVLTPLKFPVYTVATLPAAASNTYARTFVSDANAPTWNATVAGGGTVKVPVWSDGTNWKVG